MIPRVYVDNADISSVVLHESLRIALDSSSRVATAEFTIRGSGTGGAPAKWDEAFWDANSWAAPLDLLSRVEIWDESATPRKLRFGGMVSYLSYERQSPVEMQQACKCTSYAVWLENIVVTYEDFGTSHSDQYILKFLIDKYAAGRLSSAGIQQVFPVVPIGVVEGKTLRQVFEWISDLTNAYWNVAPDATVVYHARSAVQSGYSLSDQPNGTTKFPFSVRDYSKDFARPINRAIIVGAVLADGTPLHVEYVDPVSKDKFGEWMTETLDRELTDANEARLRAEAIVQANAFPRESGTLITYSDRFDVGEQVLLESREYSLQQKYLLHSAQVRQLNRDTTEYSYGFGAAPPDAERLLRVLEQWMRTEAGAGVMRGVPIEGSVSNDSLAPGFIIDADHIGSINADQIVGLIHADQIGSVNAGTVIGQIAAHQIESVNAGVIQGVIVASQIGSVNAVTIQGVIVSDQLANQIIDDLAKYADALRPVKIFEAPGELPPTMPSDSLPPNSYFYYRPDGHFYRVTPDGTTWTDVGTNPDTLTGALKFYQIGALSATNLIGLIVAAQIQSITAGQITGQIAADQIGAINASAIVGQIQANQIAGVNASVIQGTIQANQIAAVNATSIVGTISSTQIGSINAATITIGLIAHNQIGSVNAATLTVGKINSDQLNSTAIAVGGGGNKPGKLEVFNASGVVIGFIGVNGATEGGYLKTLGVGGTQAAPNFKADAAGALTILNATITITNGGYTASTGPAVFDATYTPSLAFSIEGGGQKCTQISRGTVVYEGASKIGYVGRAASGAWLEIDITGSGSNYININGSGNGVVRADGGFAVGGSAGYNGTIPAGKAVIVTKGIVTGYVP